MCFSEGDEGGNTRCSEDSEGTGSPEDDDDACCSEDDNDNTEGSSDWIAFGFYA